MRTTPDPRERSRDELASIIKREYIRAIDRKRPSDCWDAPADAILSAGYFKPREIPNEHLSSNREGVYPVPFTPGMIVESADGSIWRYDEEDFDWNSLGWGSAALLGPATVLYEGNEA